MNSNGTYKALFVEDDWDGNYIIHCENCKHEFRDESESDSQCVCPSCGAELRYPEGASW